MSFLAFIQKCSDVAKANSDSITSYGSGTLGCISGVDLAQIAGGVLIIARLIVDVPTAYDYIKTRFFTKPTPKRKRRDKSKR